VVQAQLASRRVASGRSARTTAGGDGRRYHVFTCRRTISSLRVSALGHGERRSVPFARCRRRCGWRARGRLVGWCAVHADHRARPDERGRRRARICSFSPARRADLTAAAVVRHAVAVAPPRVRVSICCWASWSRSRRMWRRTRQLPGRVHNLDATVRDHHLQQRVPALWRTSVLPIVHRSLPCRLFAHCCSYDRRIEQISSSRRRSHE